MRFSGRLACKLIILAFVVRGIFYCAMQPVWEGFDEWAHFGYIQHLAQCGRLPSRSEPVPDELQRSVELVPLSASAAEASPGSLTHDAFWKLPAEERLGRERELTELRSSYKRAPTNELRQYEAQQPPLYYLLLAAVYRAVKDDSLPLRVFVLRFVSLLISAVGIWLCCGLAFDVPASRGAAIPILLFLALWPGLIVDMSRIANDCLALTLGSVFLRCLFRMVHRDSEVHEWMLTGAALGAALLTKSYMLNLVPLLPMVALIELIRGRLTLPQVASRLVPALVVAGLTAGWWYAGVWQATGTFSGEQLDVAAAPLGVSGRLAAMRSIHWFRVLDAAASTHIWTGGWSFLVVRSWMYRVFEYVGIVTGAGLIALAVRLCSKARRRGLASGDAHLLIAACAFLLFGAAVAYFAIVVYLTRGISTTLGWYLDAIAGAEAVLLAAGFTGLLGTRRAAGCVAVVAVLAGALDLYTVHFVSIPYYAGITAHLPSGFLATFHLADLRGIGLKGVFARLSVNKPAGFEPSVIGALWLGYLGATIGLVAYALAIVKKNFFELFFVRH